MTELEQAWNKKSKEEIEKLLADYYRQALTHIQKDINDLYTRFARDNELDYAEAVQLLQGSEYRTWRMDLEEYLAQYKSTGDKEILREMNTLAMRSRITRLDKLYSETLMHVADLTGKADEAMEKFLTDAYKDFYYQSIYQIGRKTGLRAPVSVVSDEQVERVLRTPWSGKNYSQRIWKDNAKLARTVQDVVVQSTHRGTSIDTLSRLVSKRMDTGLSNARRLVRTELNFSENQAALDGIKDAGMKYYRFSATLDRRTSTMCRDHDGKVYPIEEARPGSNMPPLHPNCRSTICGSLYGPGKKKTGTRIARHDDGSTYYVPPDMTYHEWYKQKVEPIELDPMAKKFTAEYGKTSELKLGKQMQIAKLKLVSNSRFLLYAEHSASNKNRAVIFAERQLRKAEQYLPDDFEMPQVAVVDFSKYWPDVNAIGGYNKALNMVFINSQYNTEAKALKFLEEGTGYANHTSLAPYLHELGHAYYEQRIEMLAKEYSMSYTKTKEDIENQIGTLIGSKLTENYKYLMDTISEYAQDGYKNHAYGEIIAECFSMVESKGKFVDKILALLKGDKQHHETFEPGNEETK